MEELRFGVGTSIVICKQPGGVHLLSYCESHLALVFLDNREQTVLTD
jgi:hypothetical protein